MNGKLSWKILNTNRNMVTHDLYDGHARCTLYFVREFAGTVWASTDGKVSSDMEQFSDLDTAKAVCEASYLMERYDHGT